ncbi:N-acetylmuramoyl-L-alanine amidase [Clostridium sp. chh4-2]|nr:N-acetylmuramoyl-L-alanine amidase [Clostridium sp. chh4-2]
MGFCMLILVFAVSHYPLFGGGFGIAASGEAKGTQKKTVVLDVGHGGNDPGKIGVDGSLEKDINLAIAKRLKTYLEASDVEVILTRDSDTGLYGEKDNRKKMADMKKRCEIIDEIKPEIVVSIHQNSYHQEEISGGQVFYYKGSDKGKKLAEILQKRFDYVLGEANRRQAKANDNYYLLLHVKQPIVIVECGFLSNWKEAAMLNSEEYQDRLAWTIHMGIMEYLNQ